MKVARSRRSSATPAGGRGSSSRRRPTTALVGWAEITDSHGSPRGLAGIVEDLAPLVVGRDPRAVERIYWDLYRHTRQSPGSVIQKALGGIENALLDLKAKALGVPVYELFGGPTRDSIHVVLVALRHDARARVRGDRDAEARELRRRRRSRARGRRRGATAPSRRTSSSPATSRRC